MYILPSKLWMFYVHMCMDCTYLIMYIRLNFLLHMSATDESYPHPLFSSKYELAQPLLRMDQARRIENKPADHFLPQQPPDATFSWIFAIPFQLGFGEELEPV